MIARRKRVRKQGEEEGETPIKLDRGVMKYLHVLKSAMPWLPKRKVKKEKKKKPHGVYKGGETGKWAVVCTLGGLKRRRYKNC